MIRGVSFKVPKAYDRYMEKILSGVNVNAFTWRTVEDEVYSPAIRTAIEFPDGKSLAETTPETDYCIFFLNLLAFAKQSNIIDIDTYESFLKSGCEIAILVSDVVYFEIYCKNKSILETLVANAKKCAFHDVEFITDDNDGRYKISVY